MVANACVIETPGLPSEPMVAPPPSRRDRRDRGMAVDTAGSVYVTVKLAAGSSTPTVLPFTDLPNGVAVDAAGNVYVADTGNHRVLKLAAG